MNDNTKRVMVTGASHGIGRAVARALLVRGDRVVLCARDEGALMEAAAQDPQYLSGHRAHVLVADLAGSDAAACEKMVDQAAAMLGGLDALVGCAGIIRRASLDAIAEADLDAQLQVNFRAPLFLSRRAAWHIKRAGGGAIVHISSTLAERPTAESHVYAATKAALQSLVRSLAIELAADRVRVNAVLPGVVETRMQAGRSLSDLAKLHLLGRVGGAEEVARAAVFLLDEPWITGTQLTIDGGLHLA
ncbi:MAG: SDR family oxidoreductase [Polyangia bacterium]